MIASKADCRRPPRVFRNEPEHSRDFRKAWIAMLWTAMNKTGEGYPRPKAERDAPRADKDQAKRQGISNKMRASLHSLGGR